jgi:TRAP-type C4-dicarboxylate transport system permease small subunit
LWIPYFALPLGMGLLTLQALAGLLAVVTGREAPFEAPVAPQVSEPK